MDSIVVNICKKCNIKSIYDYQKETLNILLSVFKISVNAGVFLNLLNDLHKTTTLCCKMIIKMVIIFIDTPTVH